MSEALEKFKAEYIDCRPEFSTEEVLAAENAIESAWHAALEQPSTAEAQARALELEGAAKAMQVMCDGDTSEAQSYLEYRAKRIREEG